MSLPRREPWPGADVEGELEPRPGIREQPGSFHDRGWQGQRLKHARFAPKADKQADVSLGPLSAITGREQMQQTTCADVTLFDHLVGASEQRWRHVEPERPGGLEVDDEFVLGRRLHRQVGRLLAPKDAIDVTCREPGLLDLINAVGYEPAGGYEETKGINRGQTEGRLSPGERVTRARVRG
jgi:hypothetical protein